jgi:hypothetical protein
VSPVKYELGFHIPEDDILHSDRREHLKSYMGRSDLGKEQVGCCCERGNELSGSIEHWPAP